MIYVNLDKLKQQKLQQLDTYITTLLQPTDYIVIKVAEAHSDDDSELLQFLQTKYKDQLQYRKQIRIWNDKIKQEINNSTTVDQLKSIVIEYKGT
jgi:hypothetical protein